MLAPLKPVALFAALLLTSSCAASAPPPDVLSFLRVGVDPGVEARSLGEALHERGYAVSYLEGQGFVAVVARRRAPEATALRIVTWRGTMLAIDAPDDGFPHRHSVGLRAPPGDDFDLDGDGHEELVVAVVDLGRGATCLALTRILEDGRVVEVPTPAPALHPAACVERFQNVLGDARPEALVTARYYELTTDEAPSISFPLVARSPGFAAPSATALRPYLEAERGRRRRALAEAREAGAAELALRLGIELAVLGRFVGDGVAQQLEVLDGAIIGLELTAATQEILAEARRSIRAGWR